MSDNNKIRQVRITHKDKGPTLVMITRHKIGFYGLTTMYPFHRDRLTTSSLNRLDDILVNSRNVRFYSYVNRLTVSIKI